MLEDESKRDPEKYNKWYDTFQNFIKEGSQLDNDNKEAFNRLMRFNANWPGNARSWISLDDYISKMTEG